MTARRSSDLQTFVTHAEAALRQASSGDGRMRVAADRMCAALRVSWPQAGQPAGSRPPVCNHLPVALAHARRQAGPVAALADAFAVLEPRLHWKVRAGAAAYGEAFLHGHANAAIMGLDEGLEVRPDVRIGVSLMAPQTRYPDHHHPPEEIYVVLSRGEWRQANGPWHEPGIGGLVYNLPDIVHAMRSTDGPLLALWFLWTGGNDSWFRFGT